MMKINNLSQGIKNPKTGKKYSTAFKKRTVQYWLLGIHDVSIIRKKFHVSEKLLFKWRIWYFCQFEEKYLKNEPTNERGIPQGAYRILRKATKHNNKIAAIRARQECYFGNLTKSNKRTLQGGLEKKLWFETVSEVRKEYPKLSLKIVCDFFGKTRQAWYKARTQAFVKDYQEDLIVEQILSIRKHLPRSGGRKLYHIMSSFFDKNNIKIGRDLFFDLLRERNLLINRKRRKARTTNSNHGFKKHPNSAKAVIPTASNQVWVSDITYITLGSSFVYLSLITDVYSRKIVGWNLSESLRAEGAISALKMALKNLDKSSLSLIHHSDRGVQYCCKKYIEILKKNSIKVSMTEQYDPYENAIAERINRTIKEEFLDTYLFFNYKQANEAVKKAVNAYNNIRPHASVNFLTPSEAHLQNGEIRKLWKNYYPLQWQSSNSKSLT